MYLMDTYLPKRPANGHKGTFGTVLVFGGSMTASKVMLGGPALSANAAIRSGVGMAIFLGDKEILKSLIEMVPQTVGISLNYGATDSEKWDSIVIGPGLGINEANVNVIEKLLSLKLPTVIDADGLNTVSAYPKLLKQIHDRCVLTPHPKEFERLAAVIDVETPEQMAAKLGCAVIYKSSKVKIAASESIWEKEYDNPVLATGGTGDVLSGLIGGLLAQYYPELSVFECAKFGVQIHETAALKWKNTHGSGGLILDELLELVPQTMESMRA